MEINFIDLQFGSILLLLIIGFVGGLVSGFIGASGAFILTPAMMSLGVPAIVAVGTNMCHNFPKAFIGALKRVKAGQVDMKLAIVIALSAVIGVFYGASIQIYIKETFGNLGSNLYVSLVFIIVLAIVGTYALYRAIKGETSEQSRVAAWVQTVNVPGTMMYFSSIGAKVSLLFVIVLGFANGLLAATIAVGGFFGVPAMMYILGVSGLRASATHLIVAFVISLWGTIQYASSGFVDIRLVIILLAGSLFGIQLGTIGTTYVKDYMIKVVMGVLMILVLVSLALKMPFYLSELGHIEPFNESMMIVLDQASFAILILALVIGAVIILQAFISGAFKYAKKQALIEEEEAITRKAALAPFPSSSAQLLPTGRFEKIMVVSDRSDSSIAAAREAIRLAQRTDGILSVMSVIVTNPEHESLAKQLIEKENKDALANLETLKTNANDAGVDCKISLRHGIEISQEIVDEAEKSRADVIVMGRRGYTGLMRVMMGSNTAKVIGYAHCSVLIVPKTAKIEGKKILLAVDGSRYSDTAATTVMSLAKHLHASVLIVSVVYSEHQEKRYSEATEEITRVDNFLTQEGISTEGRVLSGRPAEAIVEVANAKGVDLIVMGSHGRTGLDRVLLGSVSDRVIGYAECAVLVVKAA
ncbi:hypothetical protein PN36_29980 [Candidatus Thiomargarita nelsonii]|uniref:Probable membrane transporter protein n=1 Tax=Candidatus Thiomargarita nelsonii TaxID=1003181 RepID=A0A4E0QL50_9GAMM|nr:hypothetical protein PN36_29980 [Candidatus Thiomargarita nelsonii]